MNAILSPGQWSSRDRLESYEYSAGLTNVSFHCISRRVASAFEMHRIIIKLVQLEIILSLHFKGVTTVTDEI